MDLFQTVLDNGEYRRVIFTGKHSQLAIMCLKPEEGLKDEYLESDKLVLVMSGRGKIKFGVLGEYGETDEIEQELKEGSLAGIAAGVKFDLGNNGRQDMKLAVVYAPSQLYPDEIDSSASQEFWEEPTTVPAD